MRQRWKVIGTVLFALSIGVSVAESGPAIPADKVVRAFEDFATGNEWVLARNAEHPGGPGRFILMSSSAPKSVRRPAIRPAPVIRGGDRVTVEGKNASVTTRVEGIALSSAAAGEGLKVRLAVGGWLVRAIAEGPGKAHLAGEAR
jgi:hypothetical protein